MTFLSACGRPHFLQAQEEGINKHSTVGHTLHTHKHATTHIHPLAQDVHWNHSKAQDSVMKNCRLTARLVSPEKKACGSTLKLKAHSFAFPLVWEGKTWPRAELGKPNMYTHNGATLRYLLASSPSQCDQDCTIAQKSQDSKRRGDYRVF